MNAQARESEAAVHPAELLNLLRHANGEEKLRYGRQIEYAISNRPGIRRTPGAQAQPGLGLVRPRLLAHHEVLSFDSRGPVQGMAQNAAEAVIQLNEIFNFTLRFDVAKSLLGVYRPRWPKVRALEILPPIIGKVDAPADGFRDDRQRDVQVAARPGADTTFVVFCGLRHAFGVQLNVLHHCCLADHNVNVVYLRDVPQSLYLTGVRSMGGVAETCAALGQMLARLNTRKTVFIGNSSGTFAALYYGALLDADLLLLFSGPTSLDIGMEEIERQAYPRLRELRGTGKIEWPDLRQMYGGRTTPVSLYFGGRNRVDRAQAENLQELPNVSLFPVPTASHFVLDFLAQSGELDRIFAAAAARHLG